MSRTRRINAQVKRQVAKFRRMHGRIAILRFTITSNDISDWPPLFKMPTRPMFFDRQLQPLEWDEYAVLHSFRSYCRVDHSEIGRLWISTVWLGTDYSFGTGGPIVFETMIFAKDAEDTYHPEMAAYVGAQLRYYSEDEAYQGHASVCMDIRQTLAKIDMAQEVLAEALNRKANHD